MALTASKIRAQVTADTDEAERKMRGFGKTVSDTARSSGRDLGGLGQAFGGMGLDIARFAGPAGIGLAVAGMARAAVSMDDLRQKAENTERQLIAFAGGSRQAQTATDALVRATDGGISRMSAMAQASQLMGMGLATTADQVYDLSRMATMLGDKTMGVEERMASFNAMLANQSIERLDTFGISSGRVRQRITELQAATTGLSREQAFVNAVLEIGGEKLRSVEAAGVDAASSIDKVNAALANLKQAAAEKIHVQIVIDGFAEAVDNTAHWISQAGQAEDRYAKAFDTYRQAVERVNQAQADLGMWYANITPLARENYETKLAEAQAAEQAALAELRLAQMLQDVALNGVQASEDLAEYKKSMEGTIPAAYAAAAAQDELARARQRAVFARGAYMTQRGQKYLDDREAARLAEGSYGAQLTRWAQPRTQDLGPDEVQQWVARMEAANKTVGRKTKDTIGDALKQAAREFETSLKNALQEGQRFSIGLKDFRPGGDKGPNAPGMNGAFEDIYRLQAWLTDGTWGETAAKYGGNREDIMQRVQKFQSGMWDQSVMALIDTNKIREQIEQAKLGEQMMDAVTADLAKAAGADQKLVKAMLGMGGASDQVAGRIDLSGQFVPALTTAIDAELTAKGSDLSKKGEAAWDLVESGMLSKASKSTRFVAMVNMMVDASVSRYTSGNGAQDAARAQGVPGV